MYKKEAYWNEIRRWSVLGLFVLPFLVCGLGLLLQVLGEWSLWLALRNLGAQTEATITGCRKDVNGDDITYLVMYDYTVVGESYHRQAREEVSLAWYATCRVGATVTIRYLPLSPDLSRIEGNIYRRNYLAVVACWLSVLSLTLGILLLVGRKTPISLRAKRYTAALFNGGCATSIVTPIGWLVELVVVETVGTRQGIVGLGIGFLVGLFVALLTWQPWRQETL